VREEGKKIDPSPDEREKKETPAESRHVSASNRTWRFFVGKAGIGSGRRERSEIKKKNDQDRPTNAYPLNHEGRSVAAEQKKDIEVVMEEKDRKTYVRLRVCRKEKISFSKLGKRKHSHFPAVLKQQN